MNTPPPDQLPQVALVESLPNPPPEPRRERNVGCGAALLLALGGLALAAIGITAGALGYALARGLGTPSLVVSIGAGLIGLCVVCLTTPLGVALHVAFYPGRDHPAVRTAAVLVAAALGPIVRFQEVLVFAVPAAIGSTLMFHWYQPFTASILLAVVFPLLGLVSGMLISGDGGRSTS